MIRLLDDMVERVGGIINFILCVIIASILTVAVMVFLASGYMIWLRW
jgi:hypothetical protein